MRFDTVSGVRVTHRRADVDDIETLSRRTGSEYVTDLVDGEGVSEAFGLATCHRAELYVVTDSETVGRDVLESVTTDIASDAVVHMDHRASLRHLLRVACGLESMILGEEEILGQLREAYQTHEGLGTVGSVLETAITKAIHVGQRARTETAINEGVHSITRAAVELAGREADLDGASVLLVGAGNMGTGIGRALMETAADELVVANRTRQRASRLVSEIDSLQTAAVGLGAIPEWLDDVDIVVTATGSDEFVIGPDHVAAEQAGVMVDIAQPRDVAPAVASRSGWTLHDVSALESVTGDTRRRRRRAAHRVEALVDAECRRLHEQYKQNRVEEVVSTIHSEADYVKSQHLETVLSKLDANGGLTDEQESIVASFADALLADLLAPPTQGLKHAAVHDEWTTIRAAVQLFDPMFDAESSPLDEAVRPDDLPSQLPSTRGLEND